ncbi:MAG TPA: hypothetical protein VKL40_02145 [Candidatus Angelobacter sp.]|nr:hypothetical protein [Candidatus Angelobacter sp.]
MQADYSVGLGREDPALELPWQSEDGASRYYDLKRHPDLVLQISEAAQSPELSAFLSRINAAEFPLQSAKCDAWYSQEIAPEEEIFGEPGKFVSYVDLIFAGDGPRLSLERHETLAKNLCALLKRAPEIASAVELVIRRCYYRPEDKPAESVEGFCITAYVSGFGDDEAEARRRWSIALTLLQHALVQVAR